MFAFHFTVHGGGDGVEAEGMPGTVDAQLGGGERTCRGYGVHAVSSHQRVLRRQGKDRLLIQMSLIILR